MQELLWLLLPVAAASGWWVGRCRKGEGDPRRHGAIRSDYFKGLNYLLNEQPDKAIEVFVRMVEVDSDTLETHFALGSLFRRRGEVDRAIHIHQSLIARSRLTPHERTQALHELALDYMRAGLLDRAENLFMELIDSNSHTEPALRNLVDIYQQEKEWEKAGAMARRLERIKGLSMGPVVAQYDCELAEAARARGQVDEAAQLLVRALKNDPDCVRASLLQGEWALAAGEYQEAISAYRRVEAQDPDFIPKVLEPLRTAYEALSEHTAYRAFLTNLLQRRQGVAAMLALAELILRQEGDRAAADFIVGQLRLFPSVRGLDRLIELHVGHSEGAARDTLQVLREVTRSLLGKKPFYKCHHCGFSAKTLYWQCPSCKKWNTVKPLETVEQEAHVRPPFN